MQRASLLQAFRDHRIRTAVGVAAAYVVFYVLLDALSYVQPILKLGITPWNPQAGLTLAFLLRRGPRWLWITAVAAFLAEVFVRGTATTSPAVLGASIWIAVGYGALALTLRTWQLAKPIHTPAAAARIAGASLITTLLVAGGYVGLFLTAGELPREAAAASVARYWVGDLNGILTLTPLLLCAPQWRQGWALLRAHPWELLAQFSAVILMVWIVFGIAATDELRFFYPLFVPVIWIALRWGLPGAVLAALAIQVGLVIAAQDETRAPPLIDLQFLMLTIGLTALLLGAVVTERADVLKRVAMREAEQRALLATAPDAVLAIDPAGHVRTVNPAGVRLFGAAISLNDRKRLTDLLPALRLSESEGRATLEGRRSDGQVFPAEIAWARLDPPANEGFLVTVRDATDRRRAEAQLRERDTALSRAMRFAVAGELASALAHELNQPITALVSYLRASQILAEPVASRDERLPATLGKAAQEAIRASEVLRRLRDFYSGGTLKHEPLHVGTVCGAVALAFQERLRRTNTSLVQRIEPSIPTVHADGIQLEIVLHNLLSNAIDAVGQVEKPWRRIELQAQRLGGNIVIRLEDSGPGISAEIAQKLFEPFTTSKSDGMGLGLAISRSLLRARGGELSFEPGRKLGGACFIVRLPIQIQQEEIA
jgi:PAS domain S-box-containing protein